MALNISHDVSLDDIELVRNSGDSYIGGREAEV
jgi:hypothetical protein